MPALYDGVRMSNNKGIELFSSDGLRLKSSDGFYLNASMEEVIKNVEKVSEIPTDAKRAVKDFIEYHFDELCEKLTDFDSLEISMEIIEKFPEFVEYIKLAFGAFI